MAKAELQPIYNRLNGLDNYHPLTASTFADWSLEAGDIVTVKRGNESYSSPAHTVSLNWTGSPKVTLDSRGEKSRGSVAKLAAKNFNSGGNGGNAYRGGARGYKKAEEKYADIDKNINDVVIWAKSEDDKLESRIDVQAGRIDIVVTEDKKVKAGVIVEAINKDSSVTILASRINLEGNVNLNSVMYVSSGVAIFKVPISISGGSTPVQIQNGVVTASNIRVRSGGVPWDLKIANASVDGNVLTITKVGGEKINFSKATTLTGAWTGNLTAGKSYKVEARQEGSSTPVATHFSPALDGYYTGSRHQEGNRHYLPVTVYDEKSNDLFRDDVDVTSVYEAGKASVPTYSNSATITFERSEELPSGTMRYHYYTTGTYIITSGTKTVHYN